MNKVIIIISIFVILSTKFCCSQELNSKSKWGIESSLTFPTAKIYLVKATYQICDAGKLILGPCYQNWRNDKEIPKGQANAYTLIFGYRHFLWKGINAELEFFPAYNKFESFVDNETYKGFELWIEYRLGYNFDFKIKGVDFYLNIQPGIGHALYLQNIWPGLDKKKYRQESITFIPQIAFGFEL